MADKDLNKPPFFHPIHLLIHVMQEYFQTVNEFLKLEKIEFGGIKGRSLGEMVANIFNDFQEMMNKFSSSTYDPLDMDNHVSYVTVRNNNVCVTYNLGIIVDVFTLQWLSIVSLRVCSMQ